MITIPSMPTRLRPLPELEIHLEIPQLRELAGALDRVKVESRWRAGLCLAVATEASIAVCYAFERAISRGMNKDAGEPDQYSMYLYQYFGEDDIALEELIAVRQAWAAHIARSIYEQIGDLTMDINAKLKVKRYFPNAKFFR